MNMNQLPPELARILQTIDGGTGTLRVLEVPPEIARMLERGMGEDSPATPGHERTCDCHWCKDNRFLDKINNDTELSATEKYEAAIKYIGEAAKNARNDHRVFFSKYVQAAQYAAQSDNRAWAMQQILARKEQLEQEIRNKGLEPPSDKQGLGNAELLLDRDVAESVEVTHLVQLLQDLGQMYKALRDHCPRFWLEDETDPGKLAQMRI